MDEPSGWKCVDIESMVLSGIKASYKRWQNWDERVGYAGSQLMLMIYFPARMTVKEKQRMRGLIRGQLNEVSSIDMSRWQYK